MTSISIGESTIQLEEGESVLDALVRDGVDVSHGCRAGLCQACLMAVTDGELPAQSQQGLSDAQKSMNYFLSCQCKPQGPLHIRPIDAAALRSKAVLKEKTFLGNNVLSLRFKTDLAYRSGQYITLWRDPQLGRSYSIASHPDEAHLECHIKIIDNGAFSNWAAEHLQEGDELEVQGPMGLCFYQAETDQPLLLAAIGTGLAPILGILKDALAHQHQAMITVFVAAKDCDDFYLLEELQDLTRKHANLAVHFLAQQGARDVIRQADIYEEISSLGNLVNHQVYICGGESFVKKLKKQCFLAGASMQDIHADAFVAFPT